MISAAVVLGGHERHRRRGHDVGDGRQLLRRGLRLGDERGDDVGRRRQDQHPAHDRIDLVQPELEAGRDAEVAAAAADRPEEVRVRLGVRAQELAVRGHDLGGQQVVDREAVLADEVADAAAQRDPADPDRAGVAEPGREAVGCRRGRVFAGGQPRLGPGGAAFGIDLQRPHVREVEHDPPVGDAVTGDAVAAAADGQLQPGLARQRDDASDVGRVRGPDDDRRPAVDPAVEDGAGLVVLGVVRRDHSSAKWSIELRDRDPLPG